MKKFGIFIIFTWIVRIGVLAIIAFIVLGGLAFFFNNSEPPSPDDAQYGIQTYSDDGMRIPSRIYFTNEIVYEGNEPTVNDYWAFDGKDYKHIKKDRIFTEPITIVSRRAR